jgi:hypothetical protein
VGNPRRRHGRSWLELVKLATQIGRAQSSRTGLIRSSVRTHQRQDHPEKISMENYEKKLKTFMDGEDKFIKVIDYIVCFNHEMIVVH